MNKSIRHPPSKLIGKFAFTWVMLSAFLMAALGTQTHIQTLTPRWLERLGFAPHDLWFWRWERLFTSVLITTGGQLFAPVLGIFTFSIGVVEWLAGTKRAMATFWGVHLLTMLIESLLIILPLHRLGYPRGTALTLVRDVGPSAGYFGCLGFATQRLPARLGQFIHSFILGILLINWLTPALQAEEHDTKFFADLAHLIAFPLGRLVARIDRTLG
ncbi:MAG: hypothetical protein NT075_27880 [Chloroflexi bacterium]|nr:hypothetical protein [Chloroflexota bacterium]